MAERAHAIADAPRRADPLEVFEVRAAVRAYLITVGEDDFHQAVDDLQAAAERTGLISRYGQDLVQGILADAFAPFRDALVALDDAAAIETDAPPSATPRCPIEMTAPPRPARPPGPVPASLLRKVERAGRRRPTPAATIDAVIYCVQARGLAALDEPNNLVRLSEFDDAAFARLDDAIKRMIARGTLESQNA